MTIYVYGIVPSDTDLTDERGIRDEEVFAVTEGRLSALCSSVERETLVPNEEDLWAHERVLESAMERGPVLPARFGSFFPDPPGVIDVLSERGEAFEKRLSALDGKAEIGIRAFLASLRDSDLPESTDGRSYMMNRLAQRKAEEEEIARARELWERVHAFVDGAYVEHRVTFVPNRMVAFSATYLVESESADEFVDKIDENELPDEVELFFTGPWPPYSFVDEGDST
jgi:hypothetical protein